MHVPPTPSNAPAHVQLDALGFAQLPTLSDRVDLVNRMVGRRAYSNHLVEAWAAWLAGHPEAPPETLQLLAREMLLLSPNHPQAQAVYQALSTPWDKLPKADEPVFMIASCRKYLERAQRLRDALLAKGAVAWIVTGDASRGLPTWHDQGCIVGAEDTYEALPMKVAAGIEAIVHRHGPCTVVKIDDDCRLLGSFEVEMFRQIGQKFDYVGLPVKDPCHDRLWHHGKTSRPMGPYGRRFHGPWARGACYLLSAKAADIVAREHAFYPGEFAGEFYEDKAIGDLMRRQEVVLAPLPDDATWGIAVDLEERYVAPPAVAASPEPQPQPQPEPAPAPAAAAAPATATVTPLPAMTTPTSPAAPAAHTRRNRIPKVLHLTWVGDDSKRPDNCIQTWIDQNPEWTVNIWGNEDLKNTEWVNARHIKAMWNRELNGVADLMRWEILYNHGGIVVDADSVCVRPLDDWLLEADAIACWENEITRPRLIGCNMVGSIPENPFFGQIINDLQAQESVINDMAWKTVGPLCLTTAYFKYQYTGLTILPSHFFIPDHFSGMHYGGGGIVYAKQEWASTHHGAYDTLHLKKVA